MQAVQVVKLWLVEARVQGREEEEVAKHEEGVEWPKHCVRE